MTVERISDDSGEIFAASWLWCLFLMICTDDVLNFYGLLLSKQKWCSPTGCFVCFAGCSDSKARTKSEKYSVFASCFWNWRIFEIIIFKFGREESRPNFQFHDEDQKPTRTNTTRRTMLLVLGDQSPQSPPQWASHHQPKCKSTTLTKS